MAKRWITHRAKSRRYKTRVWKQRHKTGRNSRKNYGMAFFEHPIEHELIKLRRKELGPEGVYKEYMTKKYGEKIASVFEQGYDKALNDLNLLTKKGKIKERYGKPEKKKNL